MHHKSNPLLDTALLMFGISLYAATAHRLDVLVAAAITGAFALVAAGLLASAFWVLSR